VAKKLLLEKTQNQTIAVLVDSQTAIHTMHTVLQCTKNLNELGEQNDVSIIWTPGHTGVYGNKMADHPAKCGSTIDVQGPKPYILVPYASCCNEGTGVLNDGNHHGRLITTA